MLKPRNIIYGFTKTTNPPKNKYLISIFRDKDINIFAWFTTSKRRSGVDLPCDFHGVVKRDDFNPSSYVFCKDKKIGLKPNSQDPFCFPYTTTIAFDYGSQYGLQDNILSNFENLKVVGVLSEEEYLNLVYAMYKSKDVKRKYKPYLDKILKELCK